jgi:SAM-dependent methyltransferase
MFSRSADLYDGFYASKDYAGEVAALLALVQEKASSARTLLDVACGTGKHLELLREHYAVEGLDLDPKLLAIARERLPGVLLHEGDMSAFDLGRRFDVVTCLFSSIAYMCTPDRLDRAVAAMAAHLEPGGLFVLEPWILPEQWLEHAVHALFVDEPELKAARINSGVPAAPTVKIEFHYLVGRPTGVERFEEVHEVGLFTHEQYLAAITRAGLQAEHDPEGLSGRGLYVGSSAGVQPA